MAVAVDGDDAVGDVREDRNALLALDARRAGRARRSQSATDAFAASATSACISSSRHARARARRPRARRAARPRGPASGTPRYAAVARGEHGVRRRASDGSCPTSSYATGARDWTTSPPSQPVDGERVAERLLGALAGRRRDDELVAVERRERRGVGAQQSCRLLDDLLEHRGRVELRREQAARARELLRQGTGACARPRRACCARARRAPRRPPAARARDRRRVNERALRRRRRDEAAPCRRARPGSTSRDANGPPRASVVEAARRRRRRGAREHAGRRSAASASAGGSRERAHRLRQLVRADEPSPPALGTSTAAKSPPSASAAACATASSVAARESDSPSSDGDPVEAALDARLSRASRERLGVPERERGEAGERLEHAGVRAASNGQSPPRRPTPSTPRTSPPHDIGASMTSVKPSYAGCGTGLVDPRRMCSR